MQCRQIHILNTQPTGGYIHLFIETEMLQMNERGLAQLLRLYDKHKCARHCPKAAKLKGTIYRPIHRIFSNVRRVSEDRVKDLYMHVVLLAYLMKPYTVLWDVGYRVLASETVICYSAYQHCLTMSRSLVKVLV